MTATMQFQIACDRVFGPGGGQGKWAGMSRCTAYLTIPADTMTVARRYAHEDNRWVSVQERNKINDYCPEHDPSKASTEYTIKRTTRTTMIGPRSSKFRRDK